MSGAWGNSWGATGAGGGVVVNTGVTSMVNDTRTAVEVRPYDSVVTVPPTQVSTRIAIGPVQVAVKDTSITIGVKLP